MFDSRTASDGVLRACVMVVVAARANSVPPRTRMLRGAKVVVPLIFGAAAFVRNFVVDSLGRPGQVLLFNTCGQLGLVVGEDNCYRA